MKDYLIFFTYSTLTTVCLFVCLFVCMCVLPGGQLAVCVVLEGPGLYDLQVENLFPLTDAF